MCNQELVNPVADKHVGVVASTVVAVGAEYQFFTIWRKHWEGIETIVMRNAFQPCAIYINEVKIERKAALIFVV